VLALRTVRADAAVVLAPREIPEPGAWIGHLRIRKTVPARLSKQTSSSPPGPIGNAPVLPRTTSYRVACVAAGQLYVALSATIARLWISGGAVMVLKTQPVTGSQVSVVHGLASPQLTEGEQMSTQ